MRIGYLVMDAGLRHPVRMLPILVFEAAWKLLWPAAVALPLWTAGAMDRATTEVAGSLLWVVVILAVTPWRSVVRQLVVQPGDPWRSPRGDQQPRVQAEGTGVPA